MPKSFVVRNSKGIWINTEVFREEARHFEKYGYYTSDPVGSIGWKQYWQEQAKRCIHGYEVSGVKITGLHYFYLNFVRIMAKADNSSKKVLRFPDFWDGDYEFFWLLEIAMNGISKKEYKKLRLINQVHEEDLKGGKNLIVDKARRKGFSYKAAAIISAIYNFYPNSLSIIGSYLYDYAKETFYKVRQNIDFINEYTGWSKNILYLDKGKLIHSGYKQEIGGKWVVKGFNSKVLTLTYQDNPDPARGLDAMFVAFEEAGTFPNLPEAFRATEPVTMDGNEKTGTIVMYGTSSLMETAQVFEEVWYNPQEYNAIRLKNIWAKEEELKDAWVSFFFPTHLNSVGYIDKNGNSRLEEAKKAELEERKKFKNSISLIGRMVEYPLSPEESFIQRGQSFFPVKELKAQLQRIYAENLHIKNSFPVYLYYENGKVKYEILSWDIIDPIWNYNQKVNDPRGVVIMFEPPIENAPFGLYKIGYDPYAQDQGESMAAIYVYKGIMKGELSRDIIVARYVGRPNTAEEADRIALMLAELYNTEVMYENMFIHTKYYFQRKNKLYRLAAQPDSVISKAVKQSRVQRIYGIHMTDQIKETGEKAIYEWLMTERDYVDNDKGEPVPVYNYELIYDPGLIQELIKYDRKRNTDRVMAFMMAIFQKMEDMEREYRKSDKDRVKKYFDYIQQKISIDKQTIF